MTISIKSIERQLQVNCSCESVQDALNEAIEYIADQLIRSERQNFDIHVEKARWAKKLIDTNDVSEHYINAWKCNFDHADRVINARQAEVNYQCTRLNLAKALLALAKTERSKK